jgi:HEAT repeat protein
MSRFDAPTLMWVAAGAFFTLAMFVGARAVFSQWRRTSLTSHRALAWTSINELVARLAAGDEAATAGVHKYLKKGRTARVTMSSLTNLARLDPNIAKHLRGKAELVDEIHEWVTRELTQDDPGRRAGAAETIGMLRLRTCAGLAAQAANDPDVTVRLSACRALAVVDPDRALGVLLGLVESEGVWAADLLADVVDRRNGQGMGAVVSRANEWAATPGLLRLLAQGKVAGTEKLMVDALDAEDDLIRTQASLSLRNAGTPAAARALVGSFGDKREEVRLNAVRAVGGLRDSQFALDLAAMLGDESRLVRFAAGDALSRIPGGSDLLTRAAEGSDQRAVEAAHISLWQAAHVERQTIAEAFYSDPYDR